ncbi:MAG: methylglyoxal synthase [Bacteroidota bacterium]
MIVPKRNVRLLHARKQIALIAHDHKKDDLVDWAKYNREVLALHDLYATGTTGRLLEEILGLPVQRLLSGPFGGDQQIGALIAQGEIDILIFFWDPLEAQPHDTDIKALLRLGVVWNIPIACDRSTADFLLTSPLLNTAYEVFLPDYETYRERFNQVAQEVTTQVERSEKS